MIANGMEKSDNHTELGKWGTDNRWLGKLSSGQTEASSWMIQWFNKLMDQISQSK